MADGINSYSGDLPEMTESNVTQQNYISLNLTNHYARNWGTWEGVREIVQNWHDGLYEAMEQMNINGQIVFKQHGAEYLAYASDKENEHSQRQLLGFIHYDWLTEKLFLINKHTSLQRKILLLGYSKKAYSKSVIGQFGEGLKVGALALVREGRDVTMTTGKDLWKFQLRKDEQLGEQVLTVQVRERDVKSTEGIFSRELQPEDTFVRITLEEEKWKNVRKKFLFLHPPKDYVISEIGRLLLDEELRGQLFVKGTWVADHSKEDLFAGVDFVNLNIDRDRNAVPKPSEIDHMVSCMWMQALKTRPDLIEKYFDLLMNGNYRDVRQALVFSDHENLDIISQYFFDLHGSQAYAVSPNATDDDLKALRDTLHKKIVICNETILRILLDSGSQIPLNKLMSGTSKRESTSTRIVPFMELINEERDILRHAMKMINSSQIGTFQLEQVDVLDIDGSKEKSGVRLHGDRMQVPRWMLNKEVVHKTVHGGKVLTEAQQCLCAVTHLALCLVNKSPQRLNLTGYDKLRENTGTAGWVFNLLFNMANQVCGSAKKFCIELHQAPTPGVATDHAECVNREKEYQRELATLNERMEKIQESTSKEMKSVQEHIKELENELVQWELKLMNGEEKLKKYYEKEFSLEKEKQNDLVQTIEYWKKKCSEEMNLREEMQDIFTRKERTLLEELNHYVKECQKRTDALQIFMGGQAAAAGDQISGIGILQLQELIKSISEDLQESHFMCNVCFQHRKTHMFLDCGHYSFCETCASQLFTSSVPLCPLCKCDITRVIRIYE